MTAVTKTYAWSELQEYRVNVEAVIGEELRGLKQYVIDPRRFPVPFQDRLQTDAFDVTRPIILEAVLTGGGFGVRLEQDALTGKTDVREV
jgi:hypothetical protein